MKKFSVAACTAAALLAVGVIGGCTPQKEGEEVTWETQTEGTILTRPRVDDGKIYEILPDMNFSQGFNVSKFHSNSSNGQFAGVLTHAGNAAEGTPCWQLSQWGCSNDLSQASLERQGSVLRYSDGGKSVSFDASKAGSFTLSIKGSEEYTKDENGNVRERTDGTENWPHLLMEQVGVNHSISASAKELVMTLDYEVTSCKSLVDRALYPENPDINAAQFQWFLNLTDTDPESASFQQSMWFGFSMFDTRSIGATPGGMSAYDGGKEDNTGLFIYMFSLEKAAREGNTVSLPSSVIGGKHSVKINVLPLLKSALSAAKKSGALRGASIEHLRINSTNIGWELPGNYDAEVKIENLNLYEAF